MYLKMNWKNLTELSKQIVIDFLVELHRLAIKNVSWEAKQKIQTNGAITLISTIPTFKTQPNSNFSLSEAEGFDSHCFLSNLMILKNTFSSSSLSLSILLSSAYSFFFSLFIPLFFFLIECQATCFKNSSYIFSKSGRNWYANWHVCNDQGGYLVSIETEEEWKFISHEIQKRGASNTSAWHIGLEKEYKPDWTWESGEPLNILKWRDSEPGSSDNCAEISENGGLFNGISCNDENAFICEVPGGKITFQP